MVWAKLLVQVEKPNLRLKRELCHVTGSLASGLTLFDPSPYLSKSKLECVTVQGCAQSQEGIESKGQSQHQPQQNNLNHLPKPHIGLGMFLPVIWHCSGHARDFGAFESGRWS